MSSRLYFLRLCCCGSLLLTGVACQSQRTVLAGPVVTSLDIKDTKTQAVGHVDGQGGAGFGARFNSADPYGYNQNSSNTDGQGGLNAMSEKMFGGKLQDQTQKQFTSTKNYITREYGGKKNLEEKSFQTGLRDEKSKWTDQLFATKEKNETSNTFRDGSKEAATKENSAGSKVAGTKEFAGGSKTARTGDYYPASKALSDGRDAAPLSNVSGDTSQQDENIKARIKNSQASSAEINKYLGKS